MAIRLRGVDEWLTRHKVGAAISAASAAVVGLGPDLVDSWNAIPSDWKTMLPEGWAHWIATGGFVLVTLAHFVTKDTSQNAG